jgi:CubicO group peptidase (beta-lactamase class C family)
MLTLHPTRRRSFTDNFPCAIFYRRAEGTFGHTGFTGTSMLMNMRQGLGMVLLSNRVCPSRDGPEINPCRRRIANELYQLWQC